MKYLIVLFLPLFLWGCLKNQINTSSTSTICDTKNLSLATENKKILIGSKEYVYIPAIKVIYKARIDTGATTTSIHALEIEEFMQDGQKWVKFKLSDEKGNLIENSLRVERMVSIKRHEAKDQKRYVVKMRINLDKISQVVDVSLTDRSKFTFPLLIGRNFLNGNFIVDVSKSYLTKPTKEKEL